VFRSEVVAAKKVTCFRNRQVECPPIADGTRGGATFGAIAAPLNAAQKFQFDWKAILDPTSILSSKIAAGIEWRGTSLAASSYRRSFIRIRATFIRVLAAFVRKGDNGHRQPDYSDVPGSLAAGEISTLYDPADGPRWIFRWAQRW
jgi:hypothetical protein